MDVLVVKEGLGYRSLEEMPEGSVLGTSSVRRVAQLRRKFPKLVFSDVVSLSFYTVKIYTINEKDLLHALFTQRGNLYVNYFSEAHNSCRPHLARKSQPHAFSET